ncbi:MAG TPA: hypothetical protein VLO13_09590, partial [Halomonas sp.]|nr:hypothetical protein [Halomonas sp.]
MNNKIIFSITGILVLVGAGAVLMAANENNSENTGNTPVSTQTPEVNNNAAGTSLEGTGNVDDTPQAAAEQDLNVQISMSNYEFSKEVITASPGDTITVELTSSEGTHDFVIDELGVKSEVINTGAQALVTFTIPEDAAGKSYEY